MGHNLMTRLECESLLLTRSEQGMILFEKKNITSFPPFKGPKPGFNAVGVRDCMTAVLAMSIVSEAPIGEAVLLAGLAAAQHADNLGTVVVDLNDLRSQASTTLELAELIVQVPVHCSWKSNRFLSVCFCRKPLRFEPIFLRWWRRPSSATKAEAFRP